MLIQIAALLGAYLLGAVPFGLLLAKAVLGIDPREAGSGNIGATNVARSAGKGLGVVTLVLDAIKGAAPVLIASYVLKLPLGVVAAIGLMAVLGHVFPVYLKFKGGKGVATTLGVFLALSPKPTLIAFSCFVVTFALARIVSLGSLVGALALVAAAFAIDGRVEVIALAGFLTLVVFVRHRGNIIRLVTKDEGKI